MPAATRRTAPRRDDQGVTLDRYITGLVFYATRPIGEVIGIGLMGLKALALANRKAEFLDPAALMEVLQVINERSPEFVKIHYPDVKIPAGPQLSEDPHLKDRKGALCYFDIPLVR